MLAYAHKHRHIKHIKHVRVHTTRSTHREEQVACHRLVPNGIGRRVQGTVIKPTQWPTAKTGHGTKEAVKRNGAFPAITCWSEPAEGCTHVWVCTSTVEMHVWLYIWKVQHLTFCLCAHRLCWVINIYSWWRCVQYLCHAWLAMHSM